MVAELDAPIALALLCVAQAATHYGYCRKNNKFGFHMYNLYHCPRASSACELHRLCIIYDTRNAKIDENLCNTKLFVKFFGMPVDYTEQIRLIALIIRSLRKERKLTVQELAYRCDIERSNLSRIEAGRSNLTIKTLCIICNALDVPLRALIE